MKASAKPPTPLPSSRSQPFAEFLYTCSQAPATRTMAATMVALTFWQMGGRTVTPVPPSLLLVNAGEAEADPLDTFLGNHCLGPGHGLPTRTGT